MFVEAEKKKKQKRMLDQHMDQDVQGESEKEGPRPPHSDDGLDEV